MLARQANSASLGRFSCTGQQQVWRGSLYFKIKKTVDHFSRSFLILFFSNLEILVRAGVSTVPTALMLEAAAFICWIVLTSCLYLRRPKSLPERKRKEKLLTYIHSVSEHKKLYSNFGKFKKRNKRSLFTTTINEMSIITSNVCQKIVVFSLLFLLSNLKYI